MYLILTLILVMVGFSNINAQSKYIITKEEDNGLTYRGFDEDNIPITSYTWMVENMGSYYLTAYKLIGVWRDKEGEVLRVSYQDMYSGLVVYSNWTPNDDITDLLNDFWSQYEVGDIVQIPSVKWDYEDFTPGQSTLYQGGYYGISFSHLIQ
mgnify:CR=1 FL=1